MEDNKFKNLKWIIAVAVVIIGAAIAIFFVIDNTNSKVEEMQAAQDEMQLANEQLQLSLEQAQLTSQYELLNQEFQQYEDQSKLIANDSLAERYLAAKSKVEKLIQELNSEKVKSAEQIQALKSQIRELQGEIETLKGLLRHYVAQVDSLGKANDALKEENQTVRNENTQLRAEKETVSAERSQLQEKMKLAEKLNVTGVSLRALKGNGKEEKNVTKAKQLVVTFTVPQNNSTPVGEKTFYLRIISPEGTLLGNGGSFSFEGGSVACTARKSIEYEGQEVANIPIYWDVNTALTPGDYTVELFTGNYRVASRNFQLSK